MSNNTLTAVLCILLVLLTGILGVAGMALWQTKIENVELHHKLMTQEPCVKKIIKPPSKPKAPQIRIIPQSKQPSVHTEVVNIV
jgi:hypothetical protein